MRRSRRKKKNGYFKNMTATLVANKRAAGAVLILLGIFIFLSSLTLGGSVGAFIVQHSQAWVGSVGTIGLAVLLCAFGFELLIWNALPYRRVIGGLIAGAAATVFSVASFSDESGGVFGETVTAYMNEWFSSFSFLLLPVIFIFGLWLTGLIPVERIKELWERYQEWHQARREEEWEEDEEEEYDEEEEDEEYDEEEEYEEDEYDEEEEYDDEYDEEEEEDDEKPKKSLIGRLSGKKEKKEEKGGKDEEKKMAGAVPFTHEYTPPPLSLLSNEKTSATAGNTKEMSQHIQRTFQTFGIPIQVEEVDIGPTVSRFAIKPAEGVRLSRITGLQSNLELALAAHPIRIEAPIPGRSLVGIEVPNTTRGAVRLRQLLAADEFKNSSMLLPVTIGKTVTGETLYCDIAKLPHLLIAGTTGSGKSVLVHGLLMSLIYKRSPKDVRFILVDPKRVELTLYDGIPHLYTPVITDPKMAVRALGWAVVEMERRYRILEQHKVRDLGSYNAARVKWLEKNKGKEESEGEGDEEKMPEIPSLVIVVDELADLMQIQPREMEASIVRLAQKSRAVGIHLILSTQRPSVNVITGLVKANIPSRIALRVPSQIDARTILDAVGAETLLGNGDLLMRMSDAKKPARAQGAFVSEEEVKTVVDKLISMYGRAIVDPTIASIGKEGGGQPDSAAAGGGGTDTGISLAEAMEGGATGDEEEDELFQAARETVVTTGRASTSLLQRKLKIGYSRAARLMDVLEERGVIGPQSGSKPREVLEQPGDEGG